MGRILGAARTGGADCGGVAGGMNPAPTNFPKRPDKPDGCNHPGVRRAGCPHPAGVCGGANVRGRHLGAGQSPSLRALPAASPL